MAVKDSQYCDLSLDNFLPETKDRNIFTGQLDLFLQELELGLSMDSTAVYGNPGNINLIDYVFNRYVTYQQVINDITNYVRTNCANAKYFNWTVDCTAVGQRFQRMLLITFTIRKGKETYTKKFQIRN